jgi:hypothetical protein
VTARRDLKKVTDDLVTLTTAGIADPGTRQGTEKRTRELAAEVFTLGVETSAARARMSLTVSWTAWLEVMLDTGLLEEILGLDPDLDQRFWAAFLNGKASHG